MVLYLLLWLSVVSGVWCTGPPPPVDFDIDRMVGRFYVVSDPTAQLDMSNNFKIILLSQNLLTHN